MAERRTVGGAGRFRRAARPFGGAFEGAASLSLGVAVLGAVVAALAAPSCLERHDEPQTNSDDTRCASCHGDPNRPGDYLRRAAPPKDLLQATTPAYPGVGAHEVHLNATPTHGAVACNECHLVPTTVDSPGHADNPPPAEVVFGPIARTGNRQPAYDFAARTCQGSYCHRDSGSVWTEPRDSSATCGTCHALPPPPPHPVSDRCDACHGQVIAADGHFIAPERHVNGVVDYMGGECNACHGSVNNAAPPLDTQGHDMVSAIGVGAHQVHLAGGANGRPLACGECHVVPEHVEDPTHVDGLPAEVVFDGPARAMNHSPQWVEARATCGGTYCHSPSPTEMRDSPVWNVAPTQPLDCTSCHGLPPPLPHPQAEKCSVCHGDVVAADNRTIIDKSRHVNGAPDVTLTASCTSCHGGINPAPPVDLAGNTATTAPGVGAHQAHLLATGRARPVPCGECHVVPLGVLDPGHLDSAAPAELVFSGAAIAFGAKPQYSGGSCQSTHCHGAVFTDGNPGGGTNTAPTWTRVDGTQATCGTCHGIPPPPPHPNPGNPCHNCHFDMAADDVTFIRPDLHVDGVVTYQLP